MSTLSKFGNKKSARTHDEARTCVCCVCAKKVKDNTGGVKLLSEKLANLVRQFVHTSYSIYNSSHPTAMCGTCRVTLTVFEKVFSRLFKNINSNYYLFQNPENPHRKLPALLNYHNLSQPPPKTRAAGDNSCNCQICKIARMSLAYQSFAAKHTNPVGAPPLTPKSPPAKVLAVCTRCFQETWPGKPHPCVKGQKSTNLANIVKKTSGRSRAKIASSTLKTIALDQGVSTQGGLLQLQTGSRPIPVQLGAPKIKPKNAKFSHDDLKMMQTANNLSDQTLL